MVKRFDRVYKESFVERLHVIDGCQMLDLSPSHKYERNFGSGRDVKEIRQGASFSKVFSSTSLCEVPAKANLELLNWAMFNLVIGNSDAHGKNLSYFINEKGIKLTPFYDILCILVHEDVEHDVAMAYGDEFDTNKVMAFELRVFADNVNLNFKLVSQVLDKTAKAIILAFEKSVVDESKLLDDEKVFIKKLKDIILKRAEKFKTVAAQMNKISYE
jgi:serine/threonine-protein kinase HipA